MEEQIEKGPALPAPFSDGLFLLLFGPGLLLWVTFSAAAGMWVVVRHRDSPLFVGVSL
jgi:hypothetical protein